MAAPRKRGSKWYVEVRRTGAPPAYGSFLTKGEASRWKAEVERQILLGERGNESSRTLRDLFKTFSPTRKRSWDRVRLLWFEEQMGDWKLGETTAKRIDDWAKERLNEVSPSTVLRDFSLLSASFTYAKKKLEWIKESPMPNVDRPEGNPARKRIATPDELQALCKAASYQVGTTPQTKIARVCAAFLAACETGMSIGEFAMLEPSWVNGSVLRVPVKFKTRLPRDIPLSTKAKQILADVGHDFDFTAGQADTLWRQHLRVRAKLEDLNFHDGRATFATNYSKVFDPLELAKILGHRDLAQLIKTYYRPSAQSLVDKLSAHEVVDEPDVGQPVEEPRGGQAGTAFAP